MVPEPLALMLSAESKPDGDQRERQALR